MARVAGCLCFVLSLWMVGSRQSAAISSGSHASGFWWGAKESQQIAGAEALEQRRLELSQHFQDDVAVIRSLLSVGGARALQHNYRSALTSLLGARKLAKSIGDRLDLGAADFNISSIYLQMWDVDSALSIAEEGVAAEASLQKTYYRHLVLLQLGRLHQMLDDGRAEAFLARGIEAARELGDAPEEANGWDFLGEEWLRHQQLADSERAFTEAFRIRILHCPPEVSFSYGRLGALKLAQGDLESAARLTDLAIADEERVQSVFPEYLLRHQRGRIRLARGDVAGALDDFRVAVQRASDWRREVLPATSTLTASNAELTKSIFDSFVETAAREAVKTGNMRLVRESFQAMESNRAECLRQTANLMLVWHEKLPGEYWDTLGELRGEQTRMLRPGSNPDRSDSLSLRLTEMEAEAGSRSSENEDESFCTRDSLIRLRQELSDSELLLSFHLGTRQSFVWALTRRSLNLYALPSAQRIRTEITRFRNEIMDRRAGVEQSGRKLNAELFGQLSPEESQKPAWLLSLDDALFEAPVAAFRAKSESGDVRYLAELHSLKVIPGARWLNSRSGNPAGNGWFLGVGDPIYNAADPRWQPEDRRKFMGWFAQAGTTNSALNRLVASASELESSARSWAGPQVVLSGATARREEFIALAARGPSIIHLATHVLTPAARRGQALIAFGLEPQGEAGYLTTADVAMLSVPGAIVTMTGCETGGGEARAGAGLLGLTRAWQIAGARAVISTLWPVSDSKGDIFSGFYRYLHDDSPAEALRRSQTDMIRSGTWRAEPRYWAAYQVTGGQLSR